MYVILILDERFGTWVPVGPRFGPHTEGWDAVREELTKYPGGIIAFLP